MIIYAEGGESNNNPLGTSAIDRLNSRVNSLSSRVSAITPTELSEKAYIGDTSVEFNVLTDKMVEYSVITESGMEIPSTIEYGTNSILIKFEELEEVANVTVRLF